MQKVKRFQGLRGCILMASLGLILACGLFGVVSALSNALLPAHTQQTERLSALDKARLAEAFQLRRELGDQVWPGWSKADIPAIVYNEDYAFLVGYLDPPDGWVKIPGTATRGTRWEAVTEDSFNGQVYYRQQLSTPGVTPQSFAVRVGERYVPSLTTREWMEIVMGNDFKENIPSFLQPILPYRLAGRLFLSAAGGSDWYILGTLHENFHAYEGMNDPARLAAAETLFNENESRYLWDDAKFRESWQVELKLLADAMQAKTDAETLEFTRQFVAQRQKRRAEFKLDDRLVAMEDQKEWEEGLAKYSELSMWRTAAGASGYTPLAAMKSETGFRGYTGANQRWDQEIRQMRGMAGNSGDMRFYYSGLAQAAILDRLAPGWKEKVLKNGAVFLDLLEDVAR